MTFLVGEAVCAFTGTAATAVTAAAAAPLPRKLRRLVVFMVFSSPNKYNARGFTLFRTRHATSRSHALLMRDAASGSGGRPAARSNRHHGRPPRPGTLQGD